MTMKMLKSITVEPGENATNGKEGKEFSFRIAPDMPDKPKSGRLTVKEAMKIDLTTPHAKKINLQQIVLELCQRKYLKEVAREEVAVKA